jgi:hypothetical protein
VEEFCIELLASTYLTVLYRRLRLTQGVRPLDTQAYEALLIDLEYLAAFKARSKIGLAISLKIFRRCQWVGKMFRKSMVPAYHSTA